MSAPQYPYPAPPPPSSNSSLMTALAAGAIVASLAFNGFLLYEIHDLKTDTAKGREIMQNEIETLKENSTVMTATQRKHLDDLKEELDAKSRQANAAASQAKKEALSYADQQAEKLEAENRRTAENVNKVNSDLSTVRQAADAANAKIADVGTDVSGVKTDLASTKTDLQQTKLDLKSVRGDLSSTSSLVATNDKELNELIRRGERNIVKFNISKKTKGFQKVGDISLALKNADPKKNKFTLQVNADDKLTEKKDRNINEPLQFYVSNSLYELVVNTVGKDTVSGYLSTPKYTARNN
jgi:predicted  nucleic acid-binding Zn-ribbon protein